MTAIIIVFIVQTAPPAVTLRLSGPIRSTADGNFRVANISWQENSNVRYHNKTYNITVQPAVQGCNNSCITANQSIELVLATETEYNVTVITEVCNGKLKSAISKPLFIPSNGPSNGMTLSP